MSSGKYEMTGPKTEPGASQRLSPNVTALGFVGMLTAMSSAMIYGLLPVFMVRVLGISIASVGIIEGMAESAASLVKIVSGAVSDRIGRRKPLVVFGYTLSAIIKTIFPVAGSASAVLAARVVDRLGKGILGIGTAILISADVVLAGASTIWLTALGAALWGLQLGVTQGLLGATIADVAPDHLRGTAFGVYDCVIGVGAFIASAGAGALWTVGGPSIAFGASACVALLAGLMLMLWPLPRTMRIAS